VSPLARPELFISTGAVAERLNDPKVRIVDCRFTFEGDAKKDYLAGHIPGAVHCDWSRDLSAPPPPSGHPLYMLLGPKEFAAAMSRLGIGNDTFVIGYDAAFARHAGVSTGLAVFGGIAGSCAVVLALSPDAGNALDAVLVAGAVAAEIGAARSPAGSATVDGRVWIVAAGVLAIGVLVNALGRTDAPLCEPDSPAQLHAVWHVLTAFVLFLYGTAALGPRERARPKIRA